MAAEQSEKYWIAHRPDERRHDDIACANSINTVVQEVPSKLNVGVRVIVEAARKPDEQTAQHGSRGEQPEQATSSPGLCFVLADPG